MINKSIHKLIFLPNVGESLIYINSVLVICNTLYNIRESRIRTQSKLNPTTKLKFRVIHLIIRLTFVTATFDIHQQGATHTSLSLCTTTSYVQSLHEHATCLSFQFWSKCY